MIKIRIDDGGTIQKAFGGLQQKARSQVPFATALALTRTAQRVKQEIRQEMLRVLDKPTAYALNSLFVTPATKSNVEARIWFKDEWSVGTFGTPAVKFMGPEVYGGPRGLKGSEKLLRERGILPEGLFTVPARGAPLDRYGNLKPGLMMQLLSSVGALRDIHARQTQRSMKRHKTPSEFFVMSAEGQSQPSGIWMRRGGKLLPILHFIRQPQYRIRVQFFEIGQRVVASELQGQFDQALRQALSTAR